jgi:hypothetical protein
MRGLRGVAGPLLVVVALCYWAAQALAAGGATIAAAPTVAYSQQEFGNTATDSTSAQDLCNGAEQNSWWLLPVTAGDRITIDFQGAGAQYEALYPVGTSDFNVTSASSVEHAELGSNGAQEAVVTVQQDGTMPLDFSTYDCTFGNFGVPGPYNFTVGVQHALVLSLAVASTNHHRHRTTFSLGVHNPDGVAISNPSLRVAVQRLASGKWVTVGAARPAGTIPVVWARALRGRWQSVRVEVSGPGYLSATSQPVRVKGV